MISEEAGQKYYAQIEPIVSKLPEEEREEARKQLYAAAGSCLLYTSPSPRDATLSRMPSSA